MRDPSGFHSLEQEASEPFMKDKTEAGVILDLMKKALE